MPSVADPVSLASVTRPGPDPDHRSLVVGAVRVAAPAAALVLAVTSRGDAIVLAVALGLAAWRPIPALAGALALAAASWRWASIGLGDIAGAQAVLGPAGWTEPVAAAAGSWLAGLALLAATPRGAVGAPRTLAMLATGATVAVVVAGPAPGGDLWARVLVGLGAAGAAGGLARFGASGRRGAALDGLAVAAGVGALALTSLDASGWDGVLTGEAAIEGVVIAVAAGALAAGVAGLLVAQTRSSVAARWSAGEIDP